MIHEAFHPLFDHDYKTIYYFSVLGRALFSAQHLEMNCRAIAALQHLREVTTKHPSSILEDPDFRKSVEKLWKRTLGQHIATLKEKEILSENVDEIFQSALDARNEIAHNVTIRIEAYLSSEEGLDNRINEILELVRNIAKAAKIVSAIIHISNKDPLPVNDFLMSYEDRICDWVTKDISSIVGN